ncbi:kinase-like domain-containing protein [Aspergillus avenaceus]|uniref:non-specific serine/threonine protein kinase n=1 Tax=Aspergillus avenaceus TaxID=36643 RepID=A0A5N6TF95_ASPAV|nr:kinase-like domain-containing protein [Aspergillus avenaceus]
MNWLKHLLFNSWLQLGYNNDKTHRTSPSPRTPKTSGFPILDSTPRIEEERMPAYDRGPFYPVKLGDVFVSRYQILSKLGFGANSTVWFGRDLHQHWYIALKIYIWGSENREVRVLKHLSGVKTHHPGSALVRRMIGEFEIAGPSGKHQCIVYEPLLTSLLHFQATLNSQSLPEDLLKGALQQLLLALDYLHTEAHVIHTDIQAKNIIIGSKDDSIYREWENEEEAEPSPRKIVGSSSIVYKSRPFLRKKGWSGFGMPLLSDFGEARLGDVHTGLIQPDIYRAPEVILGMRWTSKVDIWNVGVLIWDLFEDHHLFDGRAPNGNQSDAHLLAEMVAMLRPPQADFLRKSPRSPKYWDSMGQWKAAVEVPHCSLEESEEYLEGENKTLFMRFIRKMLRWDPEERQSARELLSDPWLTSQ